MFCFKTGSHQNFCENCVIVKRIFGENMPEIETYKGDLTISFGKRVIAREFAIYFGYLQERILDLNAEKVININLENTVYMNQFCISKILLTISKIKNLKEINILFPNNRGNRMLRFFYNTGILDAFWGDSFINCYIQGDMIEDYEEIYDFHNCYDHAIFPYKIFSFEKIKEESYKVVEKIVEEILKTVETFYSQSNNIEKFNQIEERVHLYLFELIDNVYKHAYTENTVTFGVNICNSYLPPYKVLEGTKEERKFEKRIIRLQREVPMSVYKDIQDRFFGGFNIFVDDIGSGITGTYHAENIESVYKDVYINGSKKRRSINGLKLVADQISINNDILWAHDRRNWVCTSFIENNNINISDNSKTRHYEHKAVFGLTYDIFVNLAQNSREKVIAYNTFGKKLCFNISQIKDIVSQDLDNFNQKAFIDLLNINNKNVVFDLNFDGNLLFYRFRAIQKNKIASELENRVIQNIKKCSNQRRFDYLVVYDLNQTTLFQAKAVFENKDNVGELIKKGIKTIILLSEECWAFVMNLKEESYFMDKSGFEDLNDKISFQNLLKAIYTNDRKALLQIITKNRYDYIYTGEINWGKTVIREYWDIEKMLYDRAIFDLLCKSIIRLSGLLSNNDKIMFLEKFMEKRLGSLVNEYKDNAQNNIFLGSMLMSGETEGRLSRNHENKIYLFKHKECSLNIEENHIILFDLPNERVTKKRGTYKRVLHTNHIEACDKNSDEFLYYLSDNYEKRLQDINYSLGFNENGFISIIEDASLYEEYVKFVLEIIKIKMNKLNSIDILLDESLNEKILEPLEKGIKEIKHNSDNSLMEATVTFNNSSKSTDLIIKLGYSFSLVDILNSIQESSHNIIFIPILNNMQFDKELANIINTGYLPFIPIYFALSDPIVGETGLEKFASFTRTLNPKYKKALDWGGQDNQIMKFNVDWKNDIIHFVERYNDEKKIHILKDTIFYIIGKENTERKKGGIEIGQYDCFIKILLLQHSIVKYDIIDRTKRILDILTFYESNKFKIQDSILTYLLLIVMRCIAFDYKMLGKFYDKNVGNELLKSNSFQLRILFADLFNENCRFKFESELNEVFVSNDITIYYNLLANLLFNSHGTIHDSKLFSITKKLQENNQMLDSEDVENIQDMIPNCISLLKLTKSYNQSLKKEEEFEKRFFEYSHNIRKNINDIKILVDEICDEAQKRFLFVDKENATEGIKNYVDVIKNVLIEKKYKIDKQDISNLNVTISDDCNTDEYGFLRRNINMYNDAIIFDELAYLLHNSHAHSFTDFSLVGNDDSQYKVWLKAELHADFLALRLLNCIEKKDGAFDEIVSAIQQKKRIGKTYLEKFNIHVSYDIPKDILVSDTECIDIFETKIKIPYFN